MGEIKEKHGHKDNILLYETLTVEEVEALRTKFINTYKNNIEDDFYRLENSISKFSVRKREIIQKILFVLVKEDLDLEHLYFNIVVPKNKDHCISTIAVNKDYLSEISYNSGKRFYSTYSGNSIYSGHRRRLLPVNRGSNSINNPLILSSDILTKYRLNKLKKIPLVNGICTVNQKKFYSTPHSSLAIFKRCLSTSTCFMLLLLTLFFCF